MKTIRGVCHHDCPDSCGWLVHVDETQPVPVALKLRGNPDHPFSRGELCPKVNRFLERVYSPDRILTPMRRVGPKGSGEFESISWPTALSEIAARWSEIIGTHGAEAIVPFWSAGNQSLLAMHAHERFVMRVGMTRLVDSICGFGAATGTALTYGTGRAADPMELEHARCIVLWGTNTRLTNRHLWPVIESARSKGAIVVCIDPLRTRTAEMADVFLQPRPGTDAALMLGLINYWVEHGQIDNDYIKNYADGFDSLREEASQWTAALVADTCGIDVGDFEQLAETIGSRSPQHFRTLIGSEHREQGGTFFQLLAALPVVLGSWRHRGGGYSRSVGTYTDGAFGSISLAAAKSNRTPTRSLSMNHLGRWLNDPLPIPVKSLMVWNANPLVTFPAAELIRAGLEREDLFTVVHEQFLTDTARYADIVLPAATQIESVDVVPSWGSLHVNWNAAAIAPVGEAVSNTELFRRLSAAMGYGDDVDLQATDEELLARAFDSSDPLLEGITMDRLHHEGTLRLSMPEEFRPYAQGGFATANGKAQLSPRGHSPTLVMPSESVSANGSTYPLSLMSSKFHQRYLNSLYGHMPNHRDPEGAPFIELSAYDASARSIQDGDVVEVINDRGRLQLVARIGTTVRQGVVMVPFGWAASSHRDGKTVNALTNDTITNVGVGVSFNDTMVEVRLVVV